VGAAIGFGAVSMGSITVLCLGMLLLGLGVGGAVVSRYAAAEMYPPERRGFAIGVVVAAGAVGAIGGPLLLTPTSAAVRHFGWAELSGPFLLATVASALAGIGLVALPLRRVRRAEQGGTDQRVALRELLGTRSSRTLLRVMVTAQLVMVAIMTAAPLDIHTRHTDLTLVGTALAAHTTGMFVLSPLTGWVIDRVGSRRVMVAGLFTLVAAAALAASAPQTQQLLPDLALFLLGYGWNLCFMAGSRRLAVDLPVQRQGQVVGVVDAVVWGVSATATLSGTALLSLGGYSLLAEIAGALPVLTVFALLRSDALPDERPATAAAHATEAAEAPRELVHEAAEG
jgi:MFS family permease